MDVLVQFHVYLTSVPVGSKWTTLGLGRITARKEHRYQLGARACLERKVSLLPGHELWPLGRPAHSRSQWRYSGSPYEGKVMVKLFLYLIRHQTIKIYGEVQSCLDAIYTSASDIGQRSDPFFGPCTPGRSGPTNSTTDQGASVCSRVAMPRQWSLNSSHNTDWSLSWIFSIIEKGHASTF